MHGNPHLPSEKRREHWDKEGTKTRANFNSGLGHSRTVPRSTRNELKWTATDVHEVTSL